VRIHELAKELGVQSKDIIASLLEMGYEGRTASSTVPEEAVPRIRAAGGRVRPGSKPKAATAEQLPTRRPEREEVTAQGGNGEVADAVAVLEQSVDAGSAPSAATQASTAAPLQAPSTGQAAPPEPTPGTAAAPEAQAAAPVLKIPHGATPQDLAERLSTSPFEIVKILFQAGEMASVTQSLSDEGIELVANELGHGIEIVSPVQEEPEEDELEEVDETRLRPRPPVVTVMGHVDHGKTLLLDAIRKTDVVAGEFGGFTQHNGAYQIHMDGREITFIDTPGHEAFTAMRARGADMTDIVILVVAADDGVMPQTVEALNHAKAAGVPIVVAVNKIDKEGADSQRVRQQLVERGIVPAEWGGEFEFVDVSAKARTNLDQLLETLLLVADLQELKADPDAPARGVVVEAHLDKGRGPIATVLVQRGTLNVGDAIVSGAVHAKVRAMQDENGRPMKEAGPAKPVQVLGWSHVPEAGDDFKVVEDEKDARRIAQERETKQRAADFASTRHTASLADLLVAARQGELPVLNLIVKADVQGSLEAIVDALEKLPQDEVRIQVVHRGVGGITENDVSLAMASDAVVMGFNVRPDPNSVALADKEGVDVRLYRVIYQMLDDIRAALSGMLAPEQREVELGRAEVRAIFRTPKGVIAGCMVTHGNITRNSMARLVRDGVIIYTGKIGSLRRFKDDVREVAEGFECGIGLENYQDIHEGDVIETYEVREVARTLA
jgi:translation initiation factor IF-2